MIRLGSLVRGERASAAAEFALCLPMMMALMFGGFEGGNYLLTEHKVIKGVRDGARYAARLPFATYDCGSGAVTDSDIETEIKNVTRTGDPSGGVARVSGWGANAGDVTVTISCDDTTNAGIYRDYGTAPRVLVATTVPYSSLFGLLGFDTTGAVVRAQSQAAVMGV